VSAVIVPFPGTNRRVRPTRERMAQNRALHDARLIMAAKAENDDWTARLLLALLQTLSSKQMALLEFRLMGPNLNTESAVQALAVVQLAMGDNKHRASVTEMLAHLGGGRE